MRVITVPFGVSFPGVPHLDHFDVLTGYGEFDRVEHGEGVRLDPGFSVCISEHQVFFFVPV